MITNSNVLAIATCAAALAVAPRATSPEPRWPKTNELHRAIFCGFPWAEGTTKEYSEALINELQKLERSGLTQGRAWVQLSRQAECSRENRNRATGVVDY